MNQVEELIRSTWRFVNPSIDGKHQFFDGTEWKSLSDEEAEKFTQDRIEEITEVMEIISELEKLPKRRWVECSIEKFVQMREELCEGILACNLPYSEKEASYNRPPTPIEEFTMFD